MKCWLFAITLLCSGYAWAEEDEAEEKVIQTKLTLSSLEEINKKFFGIRKIEEGFYVSDISMNENYDQSYKKLSANHYKKMKYDIELKPAIEGICTTRALTKIQKVTLTKVKVWDAVPIEPDQSPTYMSFELPESDLLTCDLFFLNGKDDNSVFSFPMKQLGDYFQDKRGLDVTGAAGALQGIEIPDYIKKLDSETVIAEISLGDKKLKVIRYPNEEASQSKSFEMDYTLYIDDKKLLELKADHKFSGDHLYVSGLTEIRNILDINGDGILDLILSYGGVGANDDLYFYISQKDGTYKRFNVPQAFYC